VTRVTHITVPGVAIRHPTFTSLTAGVGKLAAMVETGSSMPSKNSSSPVKLASTTVRTPVSVRTAARPIRSLPVLPNGMQAVRDPETGQVRVVYLANKIRGADLEGNRP
jgi:hypothetical protein